MLFARVSLILLIPCSVQGCGGQLPPTTCDATSTRGTPQHSSRSPLVLNDPQGLATPTCSSPGARYAWSAKCEETTAVGETCKGSAICSPTDASTSATATCTASGWVVTDGCLPSRCQRKPTFPFGLDVHGDYSNCSLPGVLGQVSPL